MAGLTFRRVTADDLEIVARLHSDPATNAHNPYGADADLDVTRSRLEEFVRHWDDYGFGYELICDADEVIGICGVRRDVWQSLQVLNLYWRLLPEFWGRGYARAAGQHALDAARAVRHREPVIARIVAGNAASEHLAEKLGMSRRPDLDATMDGADWVIYAD
jgi:RimJ/RimL family protein N-acetyltransferase